MNVWIRIRLRMEVYLYPTENSALEAQDRDEFGGMVLEVKAASLKKQLFRRNSQTLRMQQIGNPRYPSNS
jgi:hypothetical protein